MASVLRTGRVCGLILLFPLLTSCGGGGGSGGGSGNGTGGSNNYPLQITTTPSSLASPLVQGVAKLFTINAQVTGTVSTGSSTVYVVIDDTSGVLQADKVQISQNSATSYTADLITSTTLASGESKGSIDVKVCSTTACSTIYGETAVPYDFTVASATNTTALAPLSGAKDWQTERGDSSQTGYVPITLDPSSFTVRWLQSNMEQMAPDEDVTGASMVTDSADHLIIVMIPATENIETMHKSAGGLIAYSETDGSIVWFTKFTDSGGNPLGATPLAISNGVIYTTQYTIVSLGYTLGVGGGGNLIFTGLDAKTGNILFQTQISETFGFNLLDSLNRGCTPGSPVVNGNVVFVNPACIPDESGYSVALPIVAFDAATGQALWTGAAPGGYLATSFVLQGNDLFYSTPPAQTQPTLNALYQSDGTIHWQAALASDGGGDQYFTPALDGTGSAILTGNNANGPVIDRYDLTSGNLTWQITQTPPSSPATRRTLQATAVANGMVYVASGIVGIDGPGFNGTVSALNLADGTEAWSWTTPDANYTTNINALIVTDNLLFLSTDEAVYAVDLSTHKTVWTLPIPGYQMAISPSGELYIVAGTQSAITSGSYIPLSQALVAVNLH